MENIAYLQSLLNTFGRFSFLFKTFAEPLSLSNIVPNNLLSILNKYKKDINKYIYSFKPAKNQFPYADFSIDQPPIIKEVPIPTNRSISYGSFKQIIKEKSIKSIKRHSGSSFNFTGNCPFCGAPHNYIYDNNGRGQLMCKVCENTFNKDGKLYNHKDVPFYCPHCNQNSA